MNPPVKLSAIIPSPWREKPIHYIYVLYTYIYISSKKNHRLYPES